MKSNKKALYEKILRNVSKEVKRILNEDISSQGYGRLSQHANYKMDRLEREFADSGYKDPDKLKHLRFLAKMKKKLADKGNAKFIQEASEKLEKVVNKWKKGIKIFDNDTIIPIFVMQSPTGEDLNYKDKRNKGIAVYINIFKNYNPKYWDNNCSWRNIGLINRADQYLLDYIQSLLETDLYPCGFRYWDTEMEKRISEYKGMIKLVFTGADEYFGDGYINDYMDDPESVKTRYFNKTKGRGMRYKEIEY